MFKVIRSNTEIAITLLWIVRFRSHLVHSLNTSRRIHHKTFKVKGQRSRSQILC